MNKIVQLVSARMGVKCTAAERVGGGSINACYKLVTSTGTLFCKTNSASKFPHLLALEKQGLLLLQSSGAITVPQVLDAWQEQDDQLLVLQWIEEEPPTPAFWKQFGKELASLHGTGSEGFGLQYNNYMGNVEQVNTREDSWLVFFQKHRLEPMVRRCVEKGLLNGKHQSSFDKLYQKLGDIFGNDCKPALVHGDLWSGNFIAGQKPCLIDPAAYFGHPSVDLAMTTMFGGFQPGFYEAYQYHNPGGYHKEQWPVANLYPLLIHLYLFGSSYRAGIEASLAPFG